MAKGPGPALLLAAVAALFLLKGKKGNGGTVAPESDDPGSPGGEKEKPATGTPATPKAKTQEELEEEYDPEAEAQAAIDAGFDVDSNAVSFVWHRAASSSASVQ